jgi:hypothetical protein
MYSAGSRPFMARVGTFVPWHWRKSKFPRQEIARGDRPSLVFATLPRTSPTLLSVQRPHMQSKQQFRAGYPRIPLSLACTHISRIFKVKDSVSDACTYAAVTSRRLMSRVQQTCPRCPCRHTQHLREQRRETSSRCSP